MSTWRLWMWYAEFFRGRYWVYGLVAVAGLLVALLNFPALLIMRKIADADVPAKDFAAIGLGVAAILAIRVAVLALALLPVRLVVPAARATTAAMRQAALTQIYAQNWRALTTLNSAQAQARIVQETERIEQTTQALSVQVIPNVLPLIVYGLILIYISVGLLAVMVGLALILRITDFVTGGWLRAAIEVFQAAFERFQTGAARALHILPTARIHAGEAHELNVYRAAVQDLAKAGVGMAWAGSVNSQARSFVTSLLFLAMLGFGAYGVAGNLLTVGSLVAFLMAAAQAQSAFSAIMNAVQPLLMGQAALFRLKAFLDAHPAAPSPAAGVAPPPGGLVFERVSFSYDQTPILIAASMIVAQGELTVLFAPNGAGKSTVLNLALGLFQPDEGRVLVGGVPLADVDLCAYRTQIGTVPQKPAFLRGSLRENICLGHPHASQAQIDVALAIAELGPIIARLPQGLDTPTGEKLERLSGGEAQRVALARAVLCRPNLLILDEPTNHLDDAAAASLVTRLREGLPGVTILAASHDPRVLERAHAIYELRDATLVARNSARELTGET